MTASPPPVFIVGAPRSGTTLLAAMIGSHSQYAVGPESQFFSKLSAAVLRKAVDDRDWPQLAVDALAGIELAGQPVLALFGTSPAKVAAFLKQRPPSISTMLEALTVPFARERNKPGWGEKTPNHLLNLPLLRQLWPNAWIVRIMRDPRDAALSTCRLPTFSDSFLANLYLWRRWQDAAEPFLSSDKRSVTVRYESLISHPEAELTRMCRTLGIDYEAGMLEFARNAKNVSSSAETWKKGVSENLTTERMFAWKHSLDPDLRGPAAQVAHEYLAAFDYEHDPAPVRTVTAFRLSPAFVERRESFFVHQLARNTRWLPCESAREADYVLEQPEYARFRSPRLLARLAWGRFRFRLLGGRPREAKEKKA